MLPYYLFGMIFIAAWHVTLPVIAIYAKSLGAGPLLVGWTVSSTVVLPLFLAIFVGASADRSGTRRLARLSALVFSAAYALIALSVGTRQLVAGLALAGLADIGLVVATQTYVAANSAPETRDRNFGMLTVWMSVGGLAGPILGGFLADLWGYRAAFTGSCALGALALAVTWILPPGARRPGGVRGAWVTEPIRAAGEMLRSRSIVLVLLVNAFVMFAFSLRSSFFPVYLQSVGLSATLIGITFSINSFCSMAVRPTLGHAVRRFGYVAVFGFAIAITVAGLGLTPLLATFWPLAIVMGMGGVAMGFMQPLAMSQISGRASTGNKGLSLGLRISVMQLAQVIGPLVFGAAVARFGLQAAFYLGAVIAGGGFVPLAAMTQQFQLERSVSAQRTPPSPAQLSPDEPTA
jgi:DHA1 family multidrug resistance protein-like MFS transporter